MSNFVPPPLDSLVEENPQPAARFTPPPLDSLVEDGSQPNAATPPPVNQGPESPSSFFSLNPQGAGGGNNGAVVDPVQPAQQAPAAFVPPPLDSLVPDDASAQAPRPAGIGGSFNGFTPPPLDSLVPDAADQQTFLDKIKERWRAGREQAVDDQTAYRAMTGEIPWDQVKGELDPSKSIDAAKGDNWFSEGFLGAVQMVPAMVDGIAEGWKQGLAGGFAGAGAAAIGGQIGPQVLAPEELITVPVAAAGGYAVGQMYGSSSYWYKQGAGSLYHELRKEGVPHAAAQKVSVAFGVPYAAIELSQVTKLIPGGSKVLAKTVGQAVKRRLAKLAVEQGVDYVEQIGQETGQELLQIGAEAIGEFVSGVTPDPKKATAWERVKSTIQQTAASMPFLMGPRAISDTVQAVKGAKKDAAAVRAGGLGSVRVPAPADAAMPDATDAATDSTTDWSQDFTEDGVSQEDADLVAGLDSTITGDERFASATGTTGPVGLRAVRVSDTNNTLKAFLAKFQALTGTRVVFFATDVPGLNGAMKGSDPNTLYVNVASGKQVEAIVGHEWGHHVQKTDPALYKELRRVVARYTDNYRQRAREQKGDLYSGVNTLTAELTNNVLGDAFLDPKFWQAVRAENEPLANRLWTSFTQWIDSLITKASAWGTDGFTTDLESMRRELGKAAGVAMRNSSESTSQDGTSFSVTKPKTNAVAGLAGVSQHVLMAQRGQRVVAALGQVTPAEKSAMLATAQKAEKGLKSKLAKKNNKASRERLAAVQHLIEASRLSDEMYSPEMTDEKRKSAENRIASLIAKSGIADEIRSTKMSFPRAGGWEALEFSGLDKDGGLVWREIPYSFDRSSSGEMLTPGTVEYDQEVNGAAAKMRDEVMGIYRRAKSGDTAAAKIIGQAGWYKKMRSRLRREFGGIGDLFADKLGATSPNTPVRTNWDNAIEALRRAMRGDFDELMPIWAQKFDDIDRLESKLKTLIADGVKAKKTKKSIKESPEFVKAMAELKEARNFPDSILPLKESGKKFGFNGRNVIRALVDVWREVKDPNADIDHAGTAPKALNFSGNLIGFRFLATIDVWAARMLQRITGKTRIPIPAESAVSGEMLSDGRTTKAFGFGQDVFERAVKLITNDPVMSKDKTLSSLNDDDLQALVWFIEKEIWTKQNWTSAAGEGGSFEFEADLTGSAKQDKIKELRTIAGSKFSTTGERIAALADLDKLKRQVDRYVGGLSIQQSAETQGMDSVPTDADMAQLGQRISHAIYKADDGATVLASKALSTEARYGAPERSLDMEAVVRENYDPTPLWMEMQSAADEANQDSAFLARTLRHDEKVDLLMHRPGVEIYFQTSKSGKSLDEMIKLLNAEMEKHNVPGFTIVVSPHRTSSALSGVMPDAVGVRILSMPEFSARFGDTSWDGLTNKQLLAKMKAEEVNLDSLARKLTVSVPGVSLAEVFHYEVDTKFRHEYSNKTGNNSGERGSDSRKGGSRGGGAWKGRSLREAVAAAGIRAETTSPGNQLDGLQSESGSVPLGDQGLSYSVNPADSETPAEKRRKFIQSVKDADSILPEVSDRIEGIYAPVSNKRTVDEANSWINQNGLDKALASLLMVEAPSARDYAAGIEMMGRLQAAERYEDAATLAERMAERSTDQGRAIQALSLLSKLTAAGIEIFANRQVERAIKKSPKLERLHAEITRLKEELRQARIKMALGSVIMAKSGTGEPVQARINRLLVRNAGSLWGRYKQGAVAELSRKLIGPDRPRMVPALEAFTARLKRNLMDQLPAPLREAAERTGSVDEAAMIGEAVRNFDKYKEVWEEAQRHVQEQFKKNPEALKALDDYFGQILARPFSEKSLGNAVRQVMDEMNTSMQEVLVKGYRDKLKTRAQLIKVIVQRSGLKDQDALELAVAILKNFNAQQQVARGALLKQMTAMRLDRVQKSQLQKLVEMNNAGALDDGRFFEALAKQYGIPVWTPELSAKVQLLQREHEAAKNPSVKLAKAAQMLDAVHEMIPTDVFTKARALQNLALLLNPKTMIRNIGGNVVLFAADLSADSVSRWVIDPAVSIFTGERSRSSVEVGARLSGLAQPVRDFWNGYGFRRDTGATRAASMAEGVKTVLTLAKLASRGKYELADLNRGDAHVFSGLAGRMLENTLGVALSIPDRAFHQAAFKGSLMRQMKLAEDNGTSLVAPTAEMIDEAMMDAARAVFQDENFASKALLNIGKGLNLATTFGKSDRYGLGAVVLPFSQVPGSIVLRGAEWSPIGFIRSIYEAARPMAGGEFRQKDAVDSFTRALLGTGILTAGFFLARLGILSGLPDDDDDLNAMREASGFGKFSLNLSALKRALLTANWWTKQPAQPGDVTVNYDWLQPMAMPVAMGAEIAHQRDLQRLDAAGGKVSTLSPLLRDAAAGGAAALKSLEEQPLLMGIARLGQDIGQHGAITGSAMQALRAPGMFVPTVLSQINQLFDNQLRETRAGSPWEQAANQVISRVPGISEKYPPKYNVFGEAQQRYGYGGNSFVNVLVNPAFLRSVQTNPALREASQIYAATGDKGVLPNRAPVKVQALRQTVELTNEQISQYQKIMGQLTVAAYTRLAASPRFAAAPMGAKAIAAERVMTAVHTAAKLHVLAGNPDLVQEIKTLNAQKVQAQRELMNVR